MTSRSLWHSAMQAAMNEHQHQQGSGSAMGVREAMTLAYKHSCKYRYRFHQQEFYNLFGNAKVTKITCISGFLYIELNWGNFCTSKSRKTPPDRPIWSKSARSSGWAPDNDFQIGRSGTGLRGRFQIWSLDPTQFNLTSHGPKRQFQSYKARC